MVILHDSLGICLKVIDVCTIKEEESEILLIIIDSIKEINQMLWFGKFVSVRSYRLAFFASTRAIVVRI